jgi:hypothetical protein
MNVKLLAVVSYKFKVAPYGSVIVKLAYALKTRNNLELGWYLQLSNVKPTQDFSAPAANQPISV